MVKVNIANEAKPPVVIEKELPKFKLIGTIGTDIRGLECRQPMIVVKTIDLGDIFYDMEWDDALVAALVEEGAERIDDNHVDEDLLYGLTAKTVARALEIAFTTEDSSSFIVEVLLGNSHDFTLLDLDVESA